MVRHSEASGLANISDKRDHYPTQHWVNQRKISLSYFFITIPPRSCRCWPKYIASVIVLYIPTQLRMHEAHECCRKRIWSMRTRGGITCCRGGRGAG
uniref:Uncharacterized protein n=1 Tax=Arundo donax TaxID=35708 RepID=A0A0A9GL92_ARUDO